MHVCYVMDKINEHLRIENLIYFGAQVMLCGIYLALLDKHMNGIA